MKKAPLSTEHAAHLEPGNIRLFSLFPSAAHAVRDLLARSFSAARLAGRTFAWHSSDLHVATSFRIEFRRRKHDLLLRVARHETPFL